MRDRHASICRLPFDPRRGVLHVDQLRELIRPDNCHFVRTRLISLENTHNRGGGTVYTPDAMGEIATWARGHGLATHLDGARIWNAIVKTGVPAKTWGQMFDTVNVCFSKGLGTPVGSMLLGPRDLIAHARRIRKLFGGAMRQVGFLAAACEYALDHHLDRLADDHANAQALAGKLKHPVELVSGAAPGGARIQLGYIALMQKGGLKFLYPPCPNHLRSPYATATKLAAVTSPRPCTATYCAIFLAVDLAPEPSAS